MSQRVGQGDPFQCLAAVEGRAEVGYVFKMLELVEALDAVVQDAVDAGQLSVFRGEEEPLAGKCVHGLAVLEGSHDELATAGNIVAAQELTHLVAFHIDGFSSGLPARLVIAGAHITEEHQFFERRFVVLEQLVVGFDSLVAYS